ncbi:MAG: HipA domain-containing protein [Bacteroidota bacterium]
MSSSEIEVCPGTLAKGFQTYSPVCIEQMFEGKSVYHVLDFNSIQKDEHVLEQFLENRKRISISGVQEKLSFCIDQNQNKLRPTRAREQGTYILKPIPRNVRKADQVPANEHLSMQIAKQVFHLKVAESAMVFFNEGQAAYLSKRFDVKSDGGKWGIEDFAILAGKSKDSEDADFKYNYSYEAAAALIKKYVAAWKIEMEKFFSLVLFNFLISNGDAHLKNFSLLENPSGDYSLSPAYDLLNTRMHVSDTYFALNEGLFKDGYKSRTQEMYGHPDKDDFVAFGKKIGIKESRIPKLMSPFLEKQPLLLQLVEQSFLSEGAKRGYLIQYNTRRNLLNKK